MNITKRKILITLVLIFPVFSFLKAQTTGEWLKAELDINLPKKFSFAVAGQARILNNSLNLYKYLIDLDLEYKLHKRIRVDIGYRPEWRIEKNGYFYYRDKLFTGITINYSVKKRFKFKDRFRYERKTMSYIKNDWSLIPINHLRNKFEFSYNVPKSKITPSVSFEAFFPLNSFINTTMDEYRIAANIKFPLNKKNSLKTGIMYDRELYTNTLSLIIFRVSYAFKMKL